MSNACFWRLQVDDFMSGQVIDKGFLGRETLPLNI